MLPRVFPFTEYIGRPNANPDTRLPQDHLSMYIAAMVAYPYTPNNGNPLRP